jgi:hypothetical protein
MGFVGQLYAKDWFPIDEYLALQFYVCDDCRKTVGSASPSGGKAKEATISVARTLHLEALPATAAVNAQRLGVRCRFQPRRYIAYTPVADSMKQGKFNRRKLAEEELPDEHLRSDKLGGLFPYDGYEGPKINPAELDDRAVPLAGDRRYGVPVPLRPLWDLPVPILLTPGRAEL